MSCLAKPRSSKLSNQSETERFLPFESIEQVDTPGEDKLCLVGQHSFHDLLHDIVRFQHAHDERKPKTIDIVRAKMKHKSMNLMLQWC